MKKSLKELENLERGLRKHPLQAASLLRQLGRGLHATYQPRFDLSLLEDIGFIISEMDTAHLMEVIADEQDMDDYLCELFQEVLKEIQEYRRMMKEVLMMYKYEAHQNICNRFMQMSDILIGSFQTGLSRDEIERIYCFLELELHGVSNFLVQTHSIDMFK